MTGATLTGREAQARIAMSHVVARVLRRTPDLAGHSDHLPVVLAMTDALLEAGARLPSGADNERSDEQRLRIVGDWLRGLPHHLDPALDEIRRYEQEQTEHGDGAVARGVYLAHVATVLKAVDVLAAALADSEPQALREVLAADDARDPRGQDVAPGTRLLMLRADIAARLNVQEPATA